MNYQEKVSTRADVRALYEKVIANPAIRQYRGYTESKSYGWDTEAQDYVKREGEVWFENPTFDPNYVPEGSSESCDAELLDEKLVECGQQIADLQATVDVLNRQVREQEQAVVDAQERMLCAERERDEVKEALLELRRALTLLAELAGVK